MRRGKICTEEDTVEEKSVYICKRPVLPRLPGSPGVSAAGYQPLPAHPLRTASRRRQLKIRIRVEQHLVGARRHRPSRYGCHAVARLLRRGRERRRRIPARVDASLRYAREVGPVGFRRASSPLGDIPNILVRVSCLNRRQRRGRGSWSGGGRGGVGEAWIHVLVVLTAWLCRRNWATAVRRVAARHVQRCRYARRRSPSRSLGPLLPGRNIGPGKYVSISTVDLDAVPMSESQGLTLLGYTD